MKFHKVLILWSFIYLLFWNTCTIAIWEKSNYGRLTDMRMRVQVADINISTAELKCLSIYPGWTRFL